MDQSQDKGTTKLLRLSKQNKGTTGYTRDGWEGGQWGGLSTSIAKQPLVERGVVAPMGGKWV